MKNKRVLACRWVGMALITLSVIFGIGVLGSVGYMEQGGDLLRGSVQAVACGIAMVAVGKLGLALTEV
jgi:hypothetical protein